VGRDAFLGQDIASNLAFHSLVPVLLADKFSSVISSCIFGADSRFPSSVLGEEVKPR
jgi:hypothetical protein